MGFLAKVVLNLLRSLFLFNRATEKIPIHALKVFHELYFYVKHQKNLKLIQ